jgi:hypothetical protein
MTENDKILQKNALIYTCSKCNFVTGNKNNYDKHILTAKHKRMTDELQKNAKNANLFQCDCGKEYKYRQGLFSHKKKCSFEIDTVDNMIQSTEQDMSVKVFMDAIRENKEIKAILIEQFKQSEAQQKQVIEQVIELQKENTQLINKMVEITSNQMSIPTLVTNNNTTNNNQFNLNFFLNETCKDAMNIQEFIDNIKITFDELLTIGNAGFVNGLSDIFIKQLRDLEVTKRPIHCTDLKRETIYFKEEDSWNKDKNNTKLKNIIEKVEYKNVAALHRWCNENPDSKINNTDNNLLRDKIYLQTLQGDERTREKIIKNISKEIVVDKDHCEYV